MATAEQNMKKGNLNPREREKRQKSGSKGKCTTMNRAIATKKTSREEEVGEGKEQG